MNHRMNKFSSAILLSLASLAGCAVGPDYARPTALHTDAYVAGTLPVQTATTAVPGGEAQTLKSGEDIPTQWWTLYRSEALDRLVRQGLAANHSVAAAQAALESAREHAQAGSAVFLPFVDGGLSAGRQQSNSSGAGGNSGPNLYSSFNARVAVSYDLDVFGGNRRAVEALNAQADYQQYQLRGAELTLSTNIVTTVIRDASLKAQLDTTEQMIATETQLLELTQKMQVLGQVSRTDVLAQQTLLDQQRATLPPLRVQYEQNRDALAVLVGHLPSEGAGGEVSLDALHLPDELPLSLPSKLVEQRPDVRAQEALLRAANAKIGVATANELPQISLGGAYGGASNRIGDLFASNYNVWSIGANLLQPIFHGGELMHERRAAEDDFRQAAEQYRQTVLDSFQDVADVLHALDQDAELLRIQSETQNSADEQLDLTRKQYQLGAANQLYLLEAERSAQEARIAVIQARAARYADTAALFQSLGGGWWNDTQIAKQ
jgi:NodT family efflux transporter outer membrane factor (OMF) lipoprotein